VQQNKILKKADEIEETVEEVETPPVPITNRTAWVQLSQSWNDDENGTSSAGGGTGAVSSSIGGKGKNFKSKPNFNISIPNHSHQQHRRRQESHQAFSPSKKNFKVLVDFEDRAASIHSRLKRRRESPGDDDDREDSNHGGDYDSDSDDEEAKWSKKLKGPRMRMHADEEEQRMRERIRRQGANRTVSQNNRSGNINSRLSNRLNWFSAPRARHVQQKDDNY